MNMPDLDLNHDELTESIFLTRHLCARDPFLLKPESTAEQARLLMELHDLHQAPIACSNGRKSARRKDVEAAAQTRRLQALQSILPLNTASKSLPHSGMLLKS